MTAFTRSELVCVLRDCAGVDESVDLDGDILDCSFVELGYDSLAIFNTVGRIERTHGIELGEDIVSEAMTMRTLLEMINEGLAARA